MEDIFARSDWYNFYESRMNDNYRHHIRTYYKFFIDEVIKRTRSNGVFCEVGCGMGNITAEIERQRKGHFHLMIDRDPQMLKLTDANCEHVLDKKLILGDITKDWTESCIMPPYIRATIHGHGVLEHMTDEQIQATIAQQRRFSETILHYVPSFKYKVPSFGDERLMKPDQWAAIAHPDEILSFNDSFDLVLVWNQS